MKGSVITIATGTITAGDHGTINVGGTHYVANYVQNYVIPSTNERIPKKDDTTYIEEIAGCFKRLYFENTFWKCNYTANICSETFDDLYIPMTLQLHSIDGSGLKEGNLPVEDLLNSKYDISEKILLTGGPGSGRTTACRKLIHHWMNKNSLFLKDIQLAIYLRLDEVPANKTVVETILERCQFLELKYIEVLELLSRLNEKLLIILDGYDNAKESVKKSALRLFDYKHSVLEYYFGNATTVMTTSLSQAKCIYQHFNKRAHVPGLTLAGQLQHVEKYAVEDQENHSDVIESQQEWLNCCSPLFLQMLFCLLREKKGFSDSTQFWEQFCQGQEGNTTVEGTIPEICFRNLANNQNSITLADFKSAIPKENSFLLTKGIFHIVTSEEGKRVVQPVHETVMQFFATNFLQSKWDQIGNEELRRRMVTDLKIKFSATHRKCIDLFESETEVVINIELIANSISLMLKISRDKRNELSSRNSCFLPSDVANKQVKKLSESAKYSTRIRLCSEKAFHSDCMKSIDLNPLISEGIEYLSLTTDWRARKLLFRMHSNEQQVLDIPLNLFQNLQMSDKIQYCCIDVACQHCNSRSQQVHKGGLNCKVTDIFQENQLCKSALENPKATFSYMLTKSSCSNSFFGVFIALISLQTVIEFFGNMKMYFAFVNWQSALNGLELPVDISFADTNSERQIEFFKQRKLLIESSDILIERASRSIRHLGEVLKSEGYIIGSFLLNVKLQLEKFIKKVDTIPNEDNPTSVATCIDDLKRKAYDLTRLCSKRDCDFKRYDFPITKELPVFANELHQLKERSEVLKESITMNFLDRSTFAKSIKDIDLHFQLEMDDFSSIISTIENMLEISRIEYKSDKKIVTSISAVLKKFTGEQNDNGLISGLTRDVTKLYMEVIRIDNKSCNVDEMFEMEHKRFSKIRNDINSEVTYQHDILDSLLQEVREGETEKEICFQEKQIEITEMVEHMFERNCDFLRKVNDGNQELVGLQTGSAPNQDVRSFGLVIKESGAITCHSPTHTFPLKHVEDNGHSACEGYAVQKGHDVGEE